MAGLVFDKCIQHNDLPSEHADYKISCSYEFLEDGFTDWGPLSYNQSISDHKKDRVIAGEDRAQDERAMNQSEDTKISSYFNMIGEKLKLPGYVKQQSEVKRNHVLKFMASGFSCLSFF